jgi:uncharacterized YigZ family protein
MSHSYDVPAATLERELAVKKSRFIARAARVENRQAAMAFLEAVKRDYPDARHHCWAYLLGAPQSASTAAANDDGEPSGTAGKPILNVIQHKGIGDVMVVVTRYFGGIKLGAGGLTRAYSSACEAVLSALPLAQHRQMLRRRIRTDFSQEQRLRHWLAGHGVAIADVAYGDGVALTLVLPADLVPQLEAFCRANGMVAMQD